MDIANNLLDTYVQLIERMQSMIFITKNNSIIIYANTSARGVLGVHDIGYFTNTGINNENAAIKRWIFITHNQDKQLAKSEFSGLECFIKDIDNQLTPVRLSKFEFNTNSEKIYAYVAEDISTEKLLQAKMQIQDRSSDTKNQDTDNLKKLYKLNTRQYSDDNQVLQAYLQVGCELLGLETGIISKIYPDEESGGKLTYEIIAVFSSNKAISVGKKFDANNTCCHEVVKRKKIVTYKSGDPNNLQGSLRGHPVYAAIKLDSYVGIPIFIQDQVYGTLNFSSTRSSTVEFDWNTLEIVEMMGKTLSVILENRIMHEQQKKLQDQFIKLSEEDELTGIYNRRKFKEVLTGELDKFQRFYFPLCLVTFDIDFFKKINDQYGHDIGDRVLEHLAFLVKNYIRKIDKFFRVGGEEFIILFYCEIGQAWTLTDNLRLYISESTFPHKEKLTISAGVTQVHINDTIQSCFKRVDLALYRSKQNGRNQVQLIVGDE